jgi:hypothetical protein
MRKNKMIRITTVDDTNIDVNSLDEARELYITLNLQSDNIREVIEVSSNGIEDLTVLFKSRVKYVN